MSLKLFEIDPATRMVDLNKEWITTIKEFKRIVTRDKGSEGDADGRKKFQATREFTFIYHFCDYASKFDNFSEEDKIKECIRNAELPENFDLTKDKDLEDAVIKYRSMQDAPSLKLLREMKEGLHTAYKVVRKIRQTLETLLAQMDTEAVIEPEEGKKKIDPITRISNALDALLSLSNRIPDTLAKIEALEEKVKKELGDKSGLRGKKTKGHREDGGVLAPKAGVESKGGGMFDDL